MSTIHADPVQIARDYYNSHDADTFYASIWGGEDIHIGLYRGKDEPIYDASRRTVKHMASLIDGLDVDTEVLDMGSGYGGASRFLASNMDCSVTALNISERENERHRRINRRLGLDDSIEVVDGSFEDMPLDDNQFDVVWSQDALLHSGDREQAIAEAARVLKPGGCLVFADPMQSDDCPQGVLQPILDRIHLSSLGSPGFYRAVATANGLVENCFEDHTQHLTTHYARVLQETERREDELMDQVSPEYIERMKQGLKHWVNGGNSGYLVWGMFVFDNPQ